MKVPKTVLIAGEKWIVVCDKTKGGGWFDSAKYTIFVGTKYKQETFMIFLHEVTEAIIAQRGHRFRTFMDNNTNDQMCFSFNHREYENIIRDVALALVAVVK